MKGIAWCMAGGILLFLSITYWPIDLDQARIEANSSIPQTPLTLPIYFTEPTDETIDLRYLLVTPKNRSLIIRITTGFGSIRLTTSEKQSEFALSLCRSLLFP